ncbi:MAG: WXG100 family type VII secretion target [Acidimicrobiia bacterium]
MTTGTVKSTEFAINTIQAMQNILRGGLAEQIQQFTSKGDSLTPDDWDGQHAARFYQEWPSVKTALDNAIAKLDEISDNIMTVNTNIQGAGGNQ